MAVVNYTGPITSNDMVVEYAKSLGYTEILDLVTKLSVVMADKFREFVIETNGGTSTLYPEP